MRAAVPELPRGERGGRAGRRATPPPPSAWARSRPRGAPDPTRCSAVLPADHHIGDEAGVRRAWCALAIAEARETHRHHRHRADPARDRLRLHRAGARLPTLGADGVHEVARFVEKPDAPTAERYLAAGDYLWNSGMFFFTARAPARRGAPAPARAGRAAGRAASPRERLRAPASPRALPRRAGDLDRLRHHGEGAPASAWCPAASAGTTSAAGPRCPRSARPTRAATSCSATRW